MGLEEAIMGIIIVVIGFFIVYLIYNALGLGAFFVTILILAVLLVLVGILLFFLLK